MSKIEKAKELLESLLRNENVSRWDIFRNRRAIRSLITDNIEYQELSGEVELLIDTAKESL